jgi:3-phosphoshikimate 1-carboxyvinyltransferase
MAETEVAEAASNTMLDFEALTQASGLNGACDLPGHPQLSTMALAFGALVEGETTVVRCSRRPEVTAIAGPLSQLGVDVAFDGETATVQGGGLRASESVLEASTPTSFACLAGLLAGSPFGGRMATADDHAGAARGILDALESFGVVVRASEALPFQAEIGVNVLKPGSYALGEPDSAVKAAVFLAAASQSGIFEVVQDLAGEDDLEVLFRRAQGRLEKGRVEDADGHRITLEGPQTLVPRDHVLPGDATAAATLMGLAAILPGSDLSVLDANTDWKTRRLIDLLRRFNVNVEIEKTRTESGITSRTYRVESKGELRKIKVAGEYSALFRDEIPLLSVIAACAQGETVIRDVGILREGPADVVGLMVENLRRLDVRVGEMPDGLVIEGTRALQGGELDAGGDPRVALALVVAGLAAEGVSRIVNPGPVEETYPGILKRIASVVQVKGR